MVWFFVCFFFLLCPLLCFVRPLEYSEWNIVGKCQLLLLKCLRIHACGIWSQSFFRVTTVALYEVPCSSRCSILCPEILISSCLKFFLKIQNLRRTYNKVIKELVCRGRRKTVTHYCDGWKEIQNPVWFCKFINLNGQMFLVCIFSPSFYTTWNILPYRNHLL